MKENALKLLKTGAKYIIIALIWLGVWQIAHIAVSSDVLLPSPIQTVRALGRLSEDGLWAAVATSLFRIAAGFLLGMAGGCALAVISSCSRLLRDFLQPLMAVMKTTPVASFIILAVVWLNTGNVPPFTVALIVAPIFWSNVYAGIISTDRSLIEMAQMYRLSRRTMLTKLYIPSIMPYFYSAATVGIGMAWKAGVAAEVICRPADSIGKGLYESKIHLETDVMFAWTVVVIILSVLLEKTVVGILDRTIGRRVRFDKA